MQARILLNNIKLDTCNTLDYKLGKKKTNIFRVCDAVMLMMIMKKITSVGLDFLFLKLQP